MEKQRKLTIERTLEGIVTSDKMQKTVVVSVVSRVLHPLYGKYVMRSKKYKVHDQDEIAHIGDRVRIRESRPLSKDKYFSLLSIVEKAS